MALIKFRLDNQFQAVVPIAADSRAAKLVRRAGDNDFATPKLTIDSEVDNIW